MEKKANRQTLKSGAAKAWLSPRPDSREPLRPFLSLVTRHLSLAMERLLGHSHAKADALPTVNCGPWTVDFGLCPLSSRPSPDSRAGQIKPNQAKSSQIKPNQTKSSQIKPNQTIFFYARAPSPNPRQKLPTNPNPIKPN